MTTAINYKQYPPPPSEGVEGQTFFDVPQFGYYAAWDEEGWMRWDYFDQKWVALKGAEVAYLDVLFQLDERRGEPFFKNYTEALDAANAKTKESIQPWVRGSPAFTWEVVPVEGGYTIRAMSDEPDADNPQSPPSGPLPEGYDEWKWDIGSDRWYAAKGEAEKAGLAQPEYVIDASGQRWVRTTPNGAWQLAPEEAGLAQPEYVIDASGQRWVRTTPNGAWQLAPEEEEEEPVAQFLGTIEQGGWSIDQYGYVDKDGKTVIISRQPRQPIKEPSQTLDEMIAKALVGVDFNDPNYRQDEDYIRAQSLRSFQKQPTAQERLQMAIQLAQSPSDYLTLAALYVGAISRETPAKVGERIAPLAPFLQALARQFFLDIPGVTMESPGGGGGVTPPDGATPIPISEWSKRVAEVEAAQAGDPEALQREADRATLDAASYEEDGVTTSTGGLSSELTKVKAEIMGRDVIPPETVEAIKAGTYVPPLLPGEEGYIPPMGGDIWGPEDEVENLPPRQPPPHIPSYAEMGGVPGNLQIMREVQGTGRQLTKEEVAAIKAVPQIRPGQQVGDPLQPVLPVSPAQTTVTQPQVPSFEEEEYGGPKVSLEDIAAYEEIFKQRMAEARKQRTKSLQEKYNATAWGESVPAFQYGGIVPGRFPGQSQLIQAEAGETVLTPEQMQALLQQSGMFGSVYRPELQELPSFLTQPRSVSLSQLTGGALRPRSLQTIRRQSPTQRALYKPLVQSFGVPWEDWQEEEQLSTSVGGRRPGVRWRVPSMAGLR